MSDRIAVMAEGRIEQLGAPEELYDRPRTRFVADFLAVKNIFEARVEQVAAGTARLIAPGGLAFAARDDGGYSSGATVLVGIRPERIDLRPASGAPEDVAGILDDEVYLGDSTEWHVRVGSLSLVVAEGAHEAKARRRGDAVSIALDPEAVLRLEPGA
jgi:ABC-type Fe3+/spermidine/putrescine transport system ATPase subunit